MNKIALIMNAVIFVCALVGHWYGIAHFIIKKKALYLQVVAFGVGCLMFSALFQGIMVLTQGGLSHGFHIGLLGIIGSFLFLFTANFGQMDGLVDDKTKTFRKTRIISLIAPAVIIGLYMIFYHMVLYSEIRIAIGVVTAFIAPCVYYNFKHVIIYDVELGIIKQVRKYNILAVLYALLTMIKFIGEYAYIKSLYIVATVGIALIALTMTPVLKRGAEKWTI